MPRHHLLLTICLGLSLALAACNEPRVPPTARGEALSDRGVREVTVVKVWDQSSDRIDGGGDPHISHYIEVDIVSGPDKGTKLTLPYDEWNVGKLPPVKGTTLLMTPADWVQLSPSSQGRPAFGGR